MEVDDPNCTYSWWSTRDFGPIVQALPNPVNKHYFIIILLNYQIKKIIIKIYYYRLKKGPLQKVKIKVLKL